MMVIVLWVAFGLVRLKPDTTTDIPPDAANVRSVRLQADRATQADRAAQADRPADADRGRQTYVKVGCYECHGREAQGASTGPRLGPDPLPLQQFIRYVRSPRNEMPPYTTKVLSDAAIADIHAFVSSRPRPAR